MGVGVGGWVLSALLNVLIAFLSKTYFSLFVCLL